MIRPYKKSDKDLLIEVFKLNTPKYFDVKEVEDFEMYLEKNHRTYFTFEINNEIVGGTGINIDENNKTGQVTWIFFAPSHSRKGLGKLSVEHCLNILKKNKSVDDIIVTTSQYAFKFFEKFGFETNRIEKDHWGEGLHLYDMKINTRNL